MMKRCLSSSYIFIGMPRKMKPVASELSGIAVEPDPTTVKGFASVTGTYLLGLPGSECCVLLMVLRELLLAWQLLSEQLAGHPM